MSESMWPTQAGSLGTVQLNVYFEKQLYPAVDTTYELISGILPDGVTLSSSGLISGTPYIDNLIANVVGYDYTFSIQITEGSESPDIIVFTLTVWNGSLLIPPNVTGVTSPMWHNKFSHYLNSGGADDNDSIISWSIDEGQPPPNVVLFTDGLIEGVIPFKLLPFAKSQFTSIGLQSDWDTWLTEFISSSKEFDYQFTVSLRNEVDVVLQSYTIRIIYTQAPVNESWFQDNQLNITYIPDQWYCLILSSEYEVIGWNTNSILDSVINGELSQTQVLANSKSVTALTYHLKPGYDSRLPQGSYLLSDGAVTGQISFRCYRDDQINLPIDDVYIFTVRASTGMTYSEKTFSLKVIDTNTSPYENIFVRGFPPVKERLNYLSIINDQTLFPDEFIYRLSDPWFGKAPENKFLLAAGLKPTAITEYTDLLINNHYNKRLLFGDIKTAVSLDSKLNVVYEVIYIEMLDSGSTLDKNGKPIGAADTIDLQDKLKNYYIANTNTQYFILNSTKIDSSITANQEYYILTPNGLENMKHKIYANVESYNTGLLPSWMRSIQPVPDKPGYYTQPLGNISATVLAYTVPKASRVIAYNLKKNKINFNNIKFEFDRYQLANYITKNYDIGNEQFITSDPTIFDDSNTIFDQGSTTVISNVDRFTLPNINDKYLKFPKLGPFV